MNLNRYNVVNELLLTESASNYNSSIGEPEDLKSTENSGQVMILYKNKSAFPIDLPKDTPKDILLGFVPREEQSAIHRDIDLYLINDSNYGIYYTIGYKENVSYHFINADYLEPDTKLHVNTYSQQQLGRIGKIHVQLLFITAGKYFPVEPINSFIDIQGIQFYKENNFKENDYFLLTFKIRNCSR